LFLLSVLILLGSACGTRERGHDEHPRRGSRAPAADETPREGGTLRIPIAADPESFNPLLTGPERLPDPWRRIYPVLLTAEPRGAAPPFVQGDLARAWSWSPEQRTLTCTLQQGRLWEDTLRVTVGDVVRTYEAYRTAGWLTRRVPGDSLPDPGLVAVSAVDDSTVRLLYGPEVSFWRALPVAGWPVLPARKLADLGLPMLLANPLGHEPLSAASFRVTDWRHGLNLWLGPNPMASGRRKPFIDRIEMGVCPGIDSRIIRLHLGRADVVTSVPVYRLDALLEGDTIPRLHHDGIAAVEMLCWNVGRPMFSVSLRRAVSLAIDRERIVRDLLTWNGIACGGPAAGLLEPKGPADGADGADEVDGAGRADGVDGVEGATRVRGVEGAEGAKGTREELSVAGLDSAVSGETAGGLHAGEIFSAGKTGAFDSAALGETANRLQAGGTLQALMAGAFDSAGDGLRPADSATIAIGIAAGAFTGPEPGDFLPRFDPAEANRLLDLAGWSERGPDGIRMRGGVALRIEMLYERDDELRERLATLLESDVAQVGIELVAGPVAGRTLWNRFRAGLFETALVGFRPPVIPDVSELWASWGYWNGGRYAGFRVDSLCTALQREESPRAVERLARRVESIVRREGPVTFLVYRDWTALLSPRVRNFRGTAADPLRGLERVWLEDSTATATEP
jgi:ABC-type transport system substrate-binding protein